MIVTPSGGIVTTGADEADTLVYTPPVNVSVDKPPVPVGSDGAGSVEYKRGGTVSPVSGSAEETAVAGTGNKEVLLPSGTPLLPGPGAKPGPAAEAAVVVVVVVGVAALQAARDGVTRRVSVMVSMGKL